MKVVVNGGADEGRLMIAHWWPERERQWDHFSPIPAYLRHRAYQQGTKYMTMASVRFTGGILSTFAVCCPKDQPSREVGRFIALLRMGRLLKSMGLRMEKV